MSTAPKEAARRADGDAHTITRIMDGAMRVAARKGVRKFSMSDVSESANVSRGTLYRYFSSKEDVLTALADHSLYRWEQHVRAAVEAKPRRADRLQVVMTAIVGYAEAVPEARDIIRFDQDFGLTVLERNLPETVRILSDVLEPVIDEAAVVRAGIITGPELAEIVLRIAMSGFLVPASRTRQLPKRVARVWDFLNNAALDIEETAQEAGTEKLAGVAGISENRRRLGA